MLASEVEGTCSIIRQIARSVEFYMPQSTSPHPNLHTALELVRRLDKFIRIIFLVSLLSLVAISYYLTSVGVVNEAVVVTRSSAAMPEALWIVIGVIFTIIAGFIRTIGVSDTFLKWLLRSPAEPSALAINPKSGRVNQKLLEMLKKLTPLELRLFRTLRGTSVMSIVYLAHCEAVAILGFAYAHLTLNFENGLPFYGVSFLLLLIGFPSFERIEERVREVARDLN